MAAIRLRAASSGVHGARSSPVARSGLPWLDLRSRPWCRGAVERGEAGDGADLRADPCGAAGARRERAQGFCRQVLGVVPVYRAAGFIQAQTPGSRDVLVRGGRIAAGASAAASRISAFAWSTPFDYRSGGRGGSRGGRHDPRAGRVLPGRALCLLHRPRRLRGGDLARASDPARSLTSRRDRPAAGRRCALPILDPTGDRCQQGGADLVTAQQSKAGGA
jgi:hypothetical protein